MLSSRGPHGTGAGAGAGGHAVLLVGDDTDPGAATWYVLALPAGAPLPSLEEARASRMAGSRAGRVRDLTAMRGLLRGGAEQVVDMRSAGRFAGSEPEPRPGLRGGHIPGSRNLPFNELVAPDGTVLPLEALSARIEGLSVRYYGELATGTHPLIVNAALVGLFQAILSDTVTEINARAVA